MEMKHEILEKALETYQSAHDEKGRAEHVGLYRGAMR